ncbi:MAG: hypothetical protein COA38_20000, partial [Fluviicola sp.]
YMNHFSTYEDAKKINVKCAKEIVLLSLNIKRKKVHYVSTIGIYSQSEDDKVVDENTPIQNEIHLNSSGYNASKWVSENIFQDSKKFGIPLNIYRPGLMIHATKTKFIDEKQWLSLLIDTCKLTKMYFISDYEWPVMPVDLAASELVSNVVKNINSEKTHHLFHHKAKTLEEIVMAYFGEDINDMEKVTVNEFYSRIRDKDLPFTPLIYLFESQAELFKNKGIIKFNSEISEKHFESNRLIVGSNV